MKTFVNMLWRVSRLAMVALAAVALLSACGDDFDSDNPDVDVFVKQLKAGNLKVDRENERVVMPKFTADDITDLLEYADDLTLIPSFPLAPVSYNAGGKLRLGECILWIVETIRLGYNASMGCKMVHLDAQDYEGIYFLTNPEVLDAVARYREWWNNRKLPRTIWTIEPCADEPLCGSNYMWW